MKPRLNKADRWTTQHFLAAGAMAVIGVLATFDAWRDINYIARRDEEQSHIMLVPFVMIILLWVRRSRVRYCRPTGMILGPIIVAAGWLISTWGFYNHVQSFWHGGAVMVVIGCIISVLGRHALLRFIPAILVLLFIIPVPGQLRLNIAKPLQEYTTAIAHFALDMVGVQTERAGHSLVINHQQVDIIEACNGLRMVFALILVCFAFVFALPLRNWVRVLLLLASPVAAITCNLLRILPTIYLAGQPDKIWYTNFHTYSGWMMLPMAFLLLVGIVKLLRWAMIPVMRYTLAGQ